MTAPQLSVVIIGRNEGARLLACIASVHAMDFPGPVEILYVDSGSTDQSLAAATTAGARTISLQTTNPTAAKGRNAGWRAATAPTVFFLDGDTVLHPRFVAQALPAFADRTIAVVWGHRRELHPQHSLYNRVLDLDWIYPPGDTAFCGGDALFRREVLEQTTGFDETLIAGEEPELCRRILALGLRIRHVDLPMTGHDLAITRFSQYWKRATRAGHAYAEVAARFQNTANPFWTAEVDRNRNRALALLALPLAAIFLALLTRNLWPLAVAILLLAALALRTACTQRWKSPNLHTLLLYGVHSHFQQLPIFAGTLRYRRNHRSGRRSTLVEYK